MEISSLDNKRQGETVIYLTDRGVDLSNLGFDEKELAYINRAAGLDQRLIFVNRSSHWVGLLFPDKEKKGSALQESFRIDGADIQQWAAGNKVGFVQLEDLTGSDNRILAVAEGISLRNYQFLNYFSDKSKKKSSLDEIALIGPYAKLVSELKAVVKAVYFTRDLVNEPLSSLNAPKLADAITDLGNQSGFSVEVFDQAKIKSLKMGGLLAVNRGSVDPPRFCILSHEPEKPVNEHPLILVGKGIVYDTGGLSLKPTANSMDYMKSDMAGAAAVAGVIYALSELNWPVRVIGLIPATDNRPDGNAYVPGDIIEMHNGMFVEVMNTDAEGRMILADALSYAKKYDPELVIDMATLTGAAAVAVGNIGTVAMGTAGNDVFEDLSAAGEDSYERIVRFPVWDEYSKMLESENADLKNIGGRDAGAITAGKFLQRFTSYPWVHLDIAGPSFITAADGYRTFGGTGTGVRLLVQFIRRKYLSN